MGNDRMLTGYFAAMAPSRGGAKIRATARELAYQLKTRSHFVDFQPQFRDRDFVNFGGGGARSWAGSLAEIPASGRRTVRRDAVR